MKGPVETLQANAQVGNSGDSPKGDFSEYVWMAEELEEFDKKVEEEFWEEQFIERCFEELLDDEEEEEAWLAPNEQQTTQLVDALAHLGITQTPSQTIPVVASSRLNPDAPAFVPRSYGSDDS